MGKLGKVGVNWGTLGFLRSYMKVGSGEVSLGYVGSFGGVRLGLVRVSCVGLRFWCLLERF